MTQLTKVKQNTHEHIDESCNPKNTKKTNCKFPALIPSGRSSRPRRDDNGKIELDAI